MSDKDGWLVGCLVRTVGWLAVDVLYVLACSWCFGCVHTHLSLRLCLSVCLTLSLSCLCLCLSVCLSVSLSLSPSLCLLLPSTPSPSLCFSFTLCLCARRRAHQVQLRRRPAEVHPVLRGPAVRTTARQQQDLLEGRLRPPGPRFGRGGPHWGLV